MASAWTPLANITLGSTAAGVTFSSISQSYRDLVLVVTGTSTSTLGQMYVRFNGDSGSNYAYVHMFGNGVSAVSGFNSSITVAPIGFQDTESTTISIHRASIFDYAATDKHKSVLARGDNAGYAASAIASRWANAAAITSIYVFPGNGSFAAGSTFALYGVSA